MVFVGAIVFYLPFVFGRSPKLWEQPDRFLPNRYACACATRCNFGVFFRWFEAPVSPYKFLTFNAGPRSLSTVCARFLTVQGLQPVLGAEHGDAAKQGNGDAAWTTFLLQIHTTSTDALQFDTLDQGRVIGFFSVRVLTLHAQIANAR